MSAGKEISQKVAELAGQLLGEVEQDGVEVSCGCVPLPGLDIWLIASKQPGRLVEIREQFGQLLKAFFEANVGDFGEVVTHERDRILVNEGDGFKPIES